MHKNPRCVVKVERIENSKLWKRFAAERERLRSKLNREPRTLALWHGTSANDPRSIYESDTGYRVDMAKDGSLGKGLYFSADPDYSASGYSHEEKDRIDGKECYSLLLNIVLVGRCNRKKASFFKKSVDFEENKENQYDSVTDGRKKFVVYESEKVYPLYKVIYA